MVMPSAIRRVMLIAINLVMLGFLLLLIWQGTSMTVLTSNTFSTALQLNMGVVYAALPVGTSISAVYVLARLISLIRGDSPIPTSQSTMAVD